ncbi:MAG: rRNA pseudouridine synthase [Solobacterium sp.]|nr:rRNA pseudouridine synthase [Solobacterium sp.]
MRIDKYLADAGIGTRSELKKAVRSGRVSVNGKIIKDSAMHIDENADTVCFDDVPVVWRRYAYYMLNKPQGYISSTNDSGMTVLDLIYENDRDLFPCGRLDKDTEGLLLITNDGPLAHQLLSPRHHVDKEYYVKLSRDLADEAVKEIEEGIVIDGGEKCMPAEVKRISSDECMLVIHQGKFHQVKRMIAAVGNEVIYLKRIRMKNLVLDEKLAPGEYRALSQQEISGLKEQDNL